MITIEIKRMKKTRNRVAIYLKFSLSEWRIKRYFPLFLDMYIAGPFLVNPTFIFDFFPKFLKLSVLTFEIDLLLAQLIFCELKRIWISSFFDISFAFSLLNGSPISLIRSSTWFTEFLRIFGNLFERKKKWCETIRYRIVIMNEIVKSKNIFINSFFLILFIKENIKLFTFDQHISCTPDCFYKAGIFRIIFQFLSQTTYQNINGSVVKIPLHISETVQYLCS